MAYLSIFAPSLTAQVGQKRSNPRNFLPVFVGTVHFIITASMPSLSQASACATGGDRLLSSRDRTYHPQRAAGPGHQLAVHKGVIGGFCAD